MPCMAAPPRVTLKRLAEELGVSPMTISNAFNRPDQLSTELRERIVAHAHERGYAGPDPLARGLRSGRAGAIGLISDTGLSYAFADPAASAVMAGVCAAAEEEALGLLLIPHKGPAALSSAVIDGIVVYSVSQNDPLLAIAVARRLPTVVIDQPTDTGRPTVGIDDEQAARDAARHLTELGHTHVAVVAFGLDNDDQTGLADLARRRNSPYAVSRGRLAGYAQALETAGIDWAGVPVLECAGSGRAAGRAAAEELLAGTRPPTAILATSDVLALGVLDAASVAGLSVPADLSVIGFDDVPAAATAGLTTVRQDHHAKGRAAGELLLAELRGERPAQPAPLPYTLIVRASSGPSPTT
jgi:DNA-binding LacI/PurR family transcriptional regulator